MERILPAALARLPEKAEESGFALSEATLECLQELVKQACLTSVFEFGSGRSTRMFLENGCELTSLEDSDSWMRETAKTIPDEYRSRWTPEVGRLAVIFDRLLPMRGWVLTPALTAALSRAQLILVDSPSSPPFRELALLASLRHARGAVIMVDDANIPTVARYCDRLAASNRDQLLYVRTPREHGMAFFIRRPDSRPLDLRRGVLETLKGYRRFFQSP